MLGFSSLQGYYGIDEDVSEVSAPVAASPHLPRLIQPFLHR